MIQERSPWNGKRLGLSLGGLTVAALLFLSGCATARF